jgi:hypothetical protein
MQRTHARKGLFARFVETIRFGMAGSGTFGPSSVKLGSGLPSGFDIQDMGAVVAAWTLDVKVAVTCTIVARFPADARAYKSNGASDN